jgi:hypothetical protein
MTCYIDYINKFCFISSPKCGTQTLSKVLKIPIDKLYPFEEITCVLKDSSYKKIIIVRDIIDRFISGFYEDLKNNSCYYNIDITFIEYVNFIYYCFKNKIKQVNNLNVYFKEYDQIIEWGNCSNLSLPITDEEGKISGHLIYQKSHLKPFIDIITNTDKNIDVIELDQLSKYTNIRENKKHYVDDLNDETYNYKTLLSKLKKDKIYPNKHKMLNEEIINMINDIYMEDIEYINYIKQNFSYSNKQNI